MNIYGNTYVYIRVYIHTCVYMYIHTYVCACVLNSFSLVIKIYFSDFVWKPSKDWIFVSFLKSEPKYFMIWILKNKTFRIFLIINSFHKKDIFFNLIYSIMYFWRINIYFSKCVFPHKKCSYFSFIVFLKLICIHFCVDVFFFLFILVIILNKNIIYKYI